MLIFCMRCKQKTDTNNIIETVSKNGRPMVKGTCSISTCGTKKSQFVSSGAKKVTQGKKPQVKKPQGKKTQVKKTQSKKPQVKKPRGKKMKGSGISDYIPNLDTNDVAFIIQFLALKVKEKMTSEGSSANKILNDIAEKMKEFIEKAEEKEIRDMGFELEEQVGGGILENIKNKIKNVSKRDLAIVTLATMPYIASYLSRKVIDRRFELNRKFMSNEEAYRLALDSSNFLVRTIFEYS